MPHETLSCTVDKSLIEKCAQLEAEKVRLRAVVEQARETSNWFMSLEWYVLSPQAMGRLTALEVAAGAVLADQSGGNECPTTPPQVPVASVAPRPPTTPTYTETVAGIAARLSEKPGDVRPYLPPNSDVQLPAGPSRSCSSTAACDYDSSQG
jgi:hypothetical protein